MVGGIFASLYTGIPEIDSFKRSDEHNNSDKPPTDALDKAGKAIQDDYEKMGSNKFNQLPKTGPLSAEEKVLSPVNTDSASELVGPPVPKELIQPLKTGQGGKVDVAK